MRAVRSAVVGIISLGIQPGFATQAIGDLCTGGTANGTGLRAAYYNADSGTAKPVLIRLDPRVDAAAIRSAAKSHAGKPIQSVRWCGWIRPIVSGSHSFSAATDKLRMEINKQSVVDTSTGKSTSIEMEAGRVYSVLVELSDASSAAEFSLQWTPPFGVTYDIPPTVLFPPVATLQEGC